MPGLTKAIHHIALKCDNYDQYQEAIRFYSEILGMPVLRTWGEGEHSGAMLDAGNGMMELFAGGKTMDSTGTINHMALAADDVDAVIAAVRAAGYRITIEPKDIVIPSAVPFPARIAFCVGPVGEEIEIFCEK